MNIDDLIKFRNDLFFGGAVQIDWHENDRSRADFAAKNYIFHGPEYHGISKSEVIEGYKLTDTATFVKVIIDTVTSKEKEEPITLAIAGYGSGKSHMGITLSALLSTTNENLRNDILNNIKLANENIYSDIEKSFRFVEKPYIVINLNGMKDFNLPSELSRQALSIINNNNLDIKALEDLWPRFNIAINFCQRNFDIRRDLFDEYFSDDESLDTIIYNLEAHDEVVYTKINKIYYQIVGSYINAQGQESPQELIKTLSDVYCGQDGSFSGVVILFDEFGRYLEFAAEKPQVAGDAAIQQLFEAIQNNKDTSTLICFNQYELRTYLYRMSSDLQVTLQRYITRFDSAKKYYLSTNLETLFAHLIEKKNENKLVSYLMQPIFKKLFNDKQSIVKKSFKVNENQTLWNEESLFYKVIVQGCWPLDPMATWVISNLNEILQNRSSISIIKAALNKENNEIIENQYTSISAVELAKNGLVEEFCANEKQGFSTGEAELYLNIIEKIGQNLKSEEKDLLLAILLANKLKAVSVSREQNALLLSSLANTTIKVIEHSIDNLLNEFGVIEWNNTQNKYDFISDAIPRSKFIAFLDKNTSKLNQEYIEDIFANSGVEWCRVQPLSSSFSNINRIATTEWEYKSKTTNFKMLKNDLNIAFKEWCNALLPNEKRGVLLYCFISKMTTTANGVNKINEIVNDCCNELKIGDNPFPFMIIPIHDSEGILSNFLAEYTILTGNIPNDDLSKLRHFIEDYKLYLRDEIPRQFNSLKMQNTKNITTHPKIQRNIDKMGLRQASVAIFAELYSGICSFDFDGFNTIKGNAAKDSRELTMQLIAGQVNRDWVKRKTTQFKNRFNNVLQTGVCSWDVIDQQGNISLYSKYEPINDMIKDLEDEIEKKRELKVSEIIFNWIAPPYGMNLASAGLLLGVFLSSRNDSINIFFRDNLLSKSDWAQLIFKKNFIDINELSYSKIRIINEKDINQWKKLLEMWENTQRNMEKISFEKKSYQLEETIGQPPEGLFHKWTLLIERNEKVKNDINQLSKKNSELEESYAIGLNKTNAEMIIHAAANCYKKIGELNELIPSVWDEDVIEPFVVFLEKAKDGILSTFDAWLDSLYVGNISQVDRFEKDKKRLSRYLESLGLTLYAQQLDEKIRLLTVNLNHKKKMALILDEVQKFIDTTYFTDKTSIQELNKIISSSKALIKDLEVKSSNDPSNKAPQMKINEINNVFILHAEQQKEKQELKLSAYYDLVKFQNIEHIEEAYNELRHLKNVFIGRKSDLEDIDSMLLQVKLLLNVAKFIKNNRNTLSLSDIQLNIDELEKEYYSTIDNDSEVVWAFKDTIEPIFSLTERYITSLSQEWLNKHRIDKNTIETFSAVECKEKLRDLSNTPTYLVDKDFSILQEWMALLQKQLEKNKLEAVILLFEDLSEEQKREFLLRMNKPLTIG